MDIKQLKKLINEVKQERKSNQKVIFENVDEALFDRFRGTESKLNRDALDILFNLMVNLENLPDSESGSPTWTKQTVKNLYDIIYNKFAKTGALNQPENYKKQLNIASELFSKAAGRKRYTDPRQLKSLYSKLESPEVMDSIMNMMRTIGVSEEFVTKFLSNSEQELGLKQPKTNPGTPSAKSEPVSSTADTKVPKPVTGVNKPNPVSGLNSIPPQYRQVRGTTKAE
jgi:hypothetical protein